MKLQEQVASAPLTSQVAQFVAATRFSDLSQESLAAARHGVLDFFGVSIAGAAEPLSDILCKTFVRDGKSSLIGRTGTAAPHDAALINGGIAHALDYDDALGWGHPSPPILPAVLAIAEDHDLSCEAMLTAYVAGVEGATLIGRQAFETHYARGFHSTGTIGTFGAAAAVARLLELDSAAIACSLGLAGTQAAGLKCMNGTMGKPLHAAKAASNGVISAMLAAAGFTARHDVLEADQGFFFAQTGVVPTSVTPGPFGSMIGAIRFKYHAACYMTHSTIIAVTNLRRRFGFGPDDVSSVEVELSEVALGICNIEEPKNGLECKFSLRHCIAFALCGSDTAALDTFSDANATAPEYIALRRRVRVATWPGLGTEARVTITLRDGTELTEVADVDANLPTMAEQEERLLGKFLSLTTPILGDGATKLADMILNLGQRDISVRALMAATRTA